MDDTAVLTHSQLDRLLAPEFFLWATGIEDTFITDPHPKTGRTLDEYALTQHYDHWREDIERIALLGVKYARYGLPWHRIEAEPGKFDFSWPDQVFEFMLDKGVQPIVDLMHYGTPPWLKGGFGSLQYPERVAEYAGRIAERYRGRVYWYTPLNEPRITAYYCGRLGWWPPYGRSWTDFVKVMISVCRGIVLTHRRLKAIDPEIVSTHVDATDIYRPASPDAEPTARRRQEIVFLALDLVTGAVDDRHELHDWLYKHGFTEADREWFQTHRVQPDLVGLNLYPLFTNKVVKATSSGTRITMPYGEASLIDKLSTMYWDRYHVPLFISETASKDKRRMPWMNESFAAVERVRTSGIPLVGYTWWPLFALIAWAYREKNLPFQRYILQLGLYDLFMEEDKQLSRVETPLVGAYRQAVAGGYEAVGRLMNSTRREA